MYNFADDVPNTTIVKPFEPGTDQELIWFKMSLNGNNIIII